MTDELDSEPGGARASAERVTLAQALVVLFQQELHPATGISRHTIDSYKTTFRLRLRFVEDDRPELSAPNTLVERFDASVVEAFLKHLRQVRRSSLATVNVRRAAFAALGRALQRRYPELTSYCQSLLAIRSRKCPEPLVGYFELHELHALFTVCCCLNTKKTCAA